MLLIVQPGSVVHNLSLSFKVCMAEQKTFFDYCNKPSGVLFVHFGQPYAFALFLGRHSVKSISCMH